VIETCVAASRQSAAFPNFQNSGALPSRRYETDIPACFVLASAPFTEHSSCKPAGFGFNSIMSKLEQIEDQVKRLSAAGQVALRDWLDNLLEDRLGLKDEFKAEIEAGQKDIAAGR
jgi:uncharacterized protein YdcH (DUF465 family)